MNIGIQGAMALAPASGIVANPELMLATRLEVYVETRKTKRSAGTLSQEGFVSARAERQCCLENEEVIQGYIKCRTKGGMIVDVFGIEAFPEVKSTFTPYVTTMYFVGKNNGVQGC